MPSIRSVPFLVAVACVAAPLAAQDHAGHAMGAMTMTGMPELRPIPAGVNITPADVQRVAHQYLRPDAYTLVVAGPPAGETL